MKPQNGRRAANREIFRALVARWAERLRVHPRQIRIQPMTRKWGSCSRAGRVSFATALLTKPKRFREYVIVHELLHLRVSNHGRLHRAYLSAHVRSAAGVP
ncbi:MAG: M48 metallopeptidase family protein [Gemmatimonadales bacterium]